MLHHVYQLNMSQGQFVLFALSRYKDFTYPAEGVGRVHWDPGEGRGQRLGQGGRGPYHPLEEEGSGGTMASCLKKHTTIFHLW